MSWVAQFTPNYALSASDKLTCMDRMLIYTVQSNYNFTHALYLKRGARVFQRGQRNNHACTYKFTRLQNTRDSYMSCSHACAIYFLVLSTCESRLVTQFLCYKCFSSWLAKSIVIGELDLSVLGATRMPKPYI